MVNCTVPEGPIKLSADIAGYGVLVSFMLSAVMTIAAVIYAYLSDSLPKDSLNEVDQRIIKDMQHLWSRILESSPVLFCGICWLLVKRLVFRHKRNPARRRLTREQREAATTKFILNLSDQQLVVGLAILVAAIANQHTLTVFEFQVAFSLAWFSVTTHLATLDALQQYLHHNKTIRNLRVAGMLLLMVLFLYCFGVCLATVVEGPDTVPVQCYFSRTQRRRLAYGYEWQSGDISYILVFLFIPFSYIRRIRRFYNPEANMLVQVLAYFKTRSTSASQDTDPMTREQWVYMIKEGKAMHAAHERRKLLEFLERNDPVLISSKVRRLRMAVRMFAAGYQDSMLSNTPSLVFMIVYGLVQMASLRWSLDDKLDNYDMGFGQITPLVLLVLPIFAGIEGYFDAAHDTRATQNQTARRKEEVVENLDTSPIPSPNSPSNSGVADPETTVDLYDKHTLLIRRYCYSESKTIALLHIRAKTEDDYKEVLNLKAATWSIAERFHRIEKRFIPTRLVHLVPILANLYATQMAIFILFLQNDPPALILEGLYIVNLITSLYLKYIWKGRDTLAFEEYSRTLEKLRREEGLQT